MDKIIKLNTVKDYNDFLGIETPHPLVSVIDASKISLLRHVRKNIGFYVVYLKDIQCADQIRYRRRISANGMVADLSTRIITWRTSWASYAGLHFLFLRCK